MRSPLVVAVLVSLTLPCLLTGEETREVTAGPEYAAGGWFRFLFGDGYRELWTTPIQVPVLELDKEAGGLTPVREVGQMQTLGLAFEGGDGRAYTFRSLQKHPERILPPEWQKGFPAFIVRDATAGTHPAAALILHRLAEAAGVTIPRPRLVVVPDDPALGRFREAFAGQLGTLEEFPLPSREGRPGFMGATEILSTKELWDHVMRAPETGIDSRLYLRARILDLWLDNYDRHGGQWRWMRLPGEDALQALPEDPDMALLHHDGWVKANMRNHVPRLLRFTSGYSRRLDGPLMNTWDVDRWLLADLEAEAFEEIARDLQDRLTDSVIEEALREMPPEWYLIDGPDKLDALRARREGLVDYALRVYRYYADQVDVHGSDRSDRVRVRRSTDGSVEVTVALADSASPYYRRRFLPHETNEIRIYLHEGDDQVETTGPPSGSIRVRVIAGGGRKQIDDSRGGGTDVWRDAGEVVVRRGPGTRVREKSWTDPAATEDQPWVQSRSWGHWTVPYGLLWWSPDLELVIGAGFTRTSWGFRNQPNRLEHTVGVALSTADLRGKVEYLGTVRPAASELALKLRAYGSGIERVNFFGFGNDTPQETDRDRYRSEETAALLSPSLHFPVGRHTEAFVAADVRYSSSSGDDDTILGVADPYGAGQFGSMGLRAGVLLDTRERPRAPSPSLLADVLGPQSNTRVKLRLDGVLVPQAWDVEDRYYGIDGELAGYFGSSRAHLALRAGGRRLWGTYPWFDAAFVGGRNSRAYLSNRFAGDSSLYGSVELRVWLGSVTNPVLPFRVGAFALAESGRVWLEGEDSRTWHPSYGGGLLFQPLGFPITAHATVATGKEGTRFYFGSGYGF